ncbi:MAG: peptidoglycan-binding protein [Rhizobiales bacterium]|nr:peptidoglycan-binding protein [Hyphomicrobiales bacterium]
MLGTTALALLALAAGAASAQQPQPGAPKPVAAPKPAPRPTAPSAPKPDAQAAPDPAYEASLAAFEALSPQDRRAVQEALVWSGDFLGVTEGNFGKRTRDALIAFEKKNGLNPDAVIDAKELQILLAAGKKAREAVKFAPVTDAATGLRIGVPAAIMTQRTPGKAGARYASADGQIALDTAVIPVAEIDLPALFDRLKTESPTRKVTYKLARPDWVVVSGEAAGKRFYTRFAKGADAAGAPVLRGYTVYVPARKPELERVVIAIANSFEPFPAAAGHAVAAHPPGGAPAAPAAPPPPPPPALKPTPAATALAVATNRYLTLLPKDCASPTIAGREVRVLRADAASGLSLIEVSGANARPARAGAGAAAAAGAELLFVGYAAEADPGKPLDPPRAVLSVAAGVASPERQGGLGVLVGVQPGMQGAPAFDRRGVMVGFVGAAARPPTLVAGVAPLRAYPLVPVEAAQALLAAAGAPALAPAGGEPQRPASAGDVAAQIGPGLASVACLR